MKPTLAKGTRDLMPEEAIILQETVDVLKRNFELFGFNPIRTPTLEKFDTLASKYTGGAEILKETFNLVDQGKRKLGLRYDLTVPFSRFVAMNPQLKMPFKRYQIGQVFRDGPIKASRYREFTQCDCDIVGVKSIVADAECVELFLKCYEDLGLDVIVYVNNRKILDELMDTFGIKDKLRGRVILAIDKIEKKPRKEIEKEIIGLGVTKKAVNLLLDTFGSKGKKSLKEIKKILGKDSQGIKEMNELLTLVSSKKVIFLPSLARGLSYYTGTIYEVFLKDGSIPSSIGSGGRFDKMIGALMGSKLEFPAVGCSFGLDVIVNALKIKRVKVKKSVVTVLVIPIGVSLDKVWGFVKEFRDQGIATDLAVSKKGVTKNIKYADSYGIPYVFFVGENELKKGKYKLKDLDSGKEKTVTLKQAVKFLS